MHSGAPPIFLVTFIIIIIIIIRNTSNKPGVKSLLPLIKALFLSFFLTCFYKKKSDAAFLFF